MSWHQFIKTTEWVSLFEEGPVKALLDQIDRALVDPRTSHEKTQELRGQRLGIMAVGYYGEEQAAREAQPQMTDKELAERDEASLERILGHRPLWSPRRQPEPNRPRAVSRYRRKGA